MEAFKTSVPPEHRPLLEYFPGLNPYCFNKTNDNKLCGLLHRIQLVQLMNQYVENKDTAFPYAQLFFTDNLSSKMRLYQTDGLDEPFSFQMIRRGRVVADIKIDANLFNASTLANDPHPFRYDKDRSTGLLMEIALVLNKQVPPGYKLKNSLLVNSFVKQWDNK